MLETPIYYYILYMYWWCIPFKCVILITYRQRSYTPCVHAYLLTTNINSSPTAGHFLHVLHVIISWVSFTPVDPSWDDGRGRREAGWTLHEQPPNAVTGESGISASYSRGNPLAYITLELGLHIIEANGTSTKLSILPLSISIPKMSNWYFQYKFLIRCLMIISTMCTGAEATMADNILVWTVLCTISKLKWHCTQQDISIGTTESCVTLILMTCVNPPFQYCT